MSSKVILKHDHWIRLNTVMIIMIIHAIFWGIQLVGFVGTAERFVKILLSDKEKNWRVRRPNLYNMLCI